MIWYSDRDIIKSWYFLACLTLKYSRQTEFRLSKRETQVKYKWTIRFDDWEQIFLSREYLRKESIYLFRRTGSMSA